MASPEQEKLRLQSGSRVTVVGGGPVGSLQSLLLAKRGFKVDLYEKREDICTKELAEGRSYKLTLSVRGREALKEVGLENVVLEETVPIRSRMIHSQSGAVSEQHYDTKEEQCIYSIDRNRLNKLLLNYAESDPNITLNFQNQLVRGELKKKKLTFHVQTDKGKEEMETESDFIFGCDGAFSTVRHLMTGCGCFDYSQQSLKHGYKELTMPPVDGEFAMSKSSLHIWPRGSL